MIFFLFSRAIISVAQEKAHENLEEQIENAATGEDTETEDDFYLQQLEYYSKHPINVNAVEAGELQELKMLSDLQIQNFILYRNLFGPFINLYELQAIPAWDIRTIKKILPFVHIADSKNLIRSFQERLSGGDQSLMLRFSTVLQKSKGFFRNDSSSNFYMGSRSRILIRYKYNYKNLLQYGLSGDKDAGEQFFKGSQKQGFDFYSFHFFARRLGVVKSLAIGDFTVNFGQGLIHWQSLALKKNAGITSVKRQSEALRPYNSSGEYHSLRGAAITLAKRKWETTLFVSIRKLSGTIKTDSFQNEQLYVSSLLSSGYHRTQTESEVRNNLQSIVMGVNLKYHASRWNTGFSMVQYSFSKPFRRSEKPYDLFSIEGKRWNNFSFDYSYTFRNIHTYGEFAADRNFNTAILQGMIASIDRSVDIAVVFRKIGRAYQSLYGNAFTENGLPTNETGLYTGISIRPANTWKIDAYSDLFKFPWLKFRSDAPGYGSDYLMQITLTPNKQVEMYMRYKGESKQSNSGVDLYTSQVLSVPRRNLRYQVSYKLNRQVVIRNRVEALWYGNEPDKNENGYTAFIDVGYKSNSKPVSGNIRFQYFETDGYNSRLYAYENDVLYSYSIPAVFDKGFRWYINIKTDVSKWMWPRNKAVKLDGWMKYAATRYFELDKIGTQLDEIQGKLRSEFKLQLLFSR